MRNTFSLNSLNAIETIIFRPFGAEIIALINWGFIGSLWQISPRLIFLLISMENAFRCN